MVLGKLSARVRPALTGDRPNGVRSGRLSDDLIDIDGIDVAALSSGDLAALGDSALGHAVRQLLALGATGRAPSADDPIAAHDSHV